MKRILITLALAMPLCASDIGPYGFATGFTPTQKYLDLALQQAEGEWGIKPVGQVSISLADLGNCDFTSNPHPDIAHTATNSSTFIAEGSGKPTVTWSFQILINAQCKWAMNPAPANMYFAITPAAKPIKRKGNAPLWTIQFLPATVLHEVGHIVGDDSHSENPKSIMYPVVDPRGNQVIMTDDLEKARRLSADRTDGFDKLPEGLMICKDNNHGLCVAPGYKLCPGTPHGVCREQ